MFINDTDIVLKNRPRPRPVIAWPGGKTRLLRHLLPLVPKHNLYCEVFGGGLALFLAKPESPVEVVNDINGELVSFYRQVKFHLDPLLDELDYVLNSRQEFADYLSQPGLTEIQRAARWFIRNKISFGGMGSHFAATPTQPHSSRANRLLALRTLNHRFDRTTIERLPWDQCLDAYEHAAAFYFLDPPYFDEGRTYAAWTEAEFLRFAERVRRLRGRWILTFQDCPLARREFKHCRISPVERANGIGNTNAKTKRVYRELIIQPK